MLRLSRRLVLEFVRILLIVSFLLVDLPVIPARAQEAPPVEPAAVTAITPRALTLNGTDAYVDVSHDAALNPTTGATFEAWIYPTSLNGCRTIFGKNYNEGYWVGLCGGRIRFHTGGSAQQDGTTILPINSWTHVAVVWHPANGQRRYYINGNVEYIGTSGPAPTGTRELRIGNDYPWDFFQGYIAEARIWDVARAQNDIRRTMHTYLDEKMPGLVGAWHFTDSLDDAIGGRVGAGRGTGIGYVAAPQDNLRPFPVHFPTAPADSAFNSLPHRRYGAATVFIPTLNRALLIGGNVEGVISNRIDAIDGGTGDFTALSTLPSPLLQPAAAYAPDTDTVYVFGGFSTAAQDAIYAVNPVSGEARTLAAKLTVAVSAPTAVYHPGLHKIFVIGGFGGEEGAPLGLELVSVFDPVSETLVPASFGLPTGMVQSTAAYSAATESIFLFGGTDAAGAAMDRIVEIRASGDGVTGAATQIAAKLTKADFGLNAVVDAKSQLIYLLGSSVLEWVVAFDPATGQIWQTPSKQPDVRQWASALYSERNRHALVVGGFKSSGQANVWKIALGDGPAVELGRWDFLSFGYNINDIDGNYQRVVIGMNGNIYSIGINGQGQFSSPITLGGTNVRKVRYDPATGRTYLVIDTNRVVYDNGSSIIKVWPRNTETDTVNDFNFASGMWIIGTSVNNSVPQGYGSLLWNWGLGGFPYWSANWKGCYGSHSLLARKQGEIWGLVTDIGPCGPRSAGPEPREVDANGDIYMQGMTYNWLTGVASEFDYGRICNAGGFKPNYSTEMLFGLNGDFWVSGSGGVCRYPAATVPGTFGVNWDFNVMNTPTGPNTNSASVDSDGRVWFGVDSAASQTGGLTVFEVTGKTPTRQSVWTTDYTWLNAPIGSLTRIGVDWLSAVGAVKAVGERVWSARGPDLFTIAQRWQQLDQNNNLRAKQIRGVWTARGRLFVATETDLHILQPDGVSWDNLAVAGVKSVIGDRRGRVWIGSADGVQLYVPGGVEAVPSPTPAPTGPILALAEDGQGRVWIGGAQGVTLYDRGRFVTTMAVPTGGTITSLLADRDNLLWVGTDAGLARFDPGDASWATFTTDNGLPNNSVSDVVQLRNGWFAISHAGGVVQYRGDTTFVGYSISGAHLPLSVDERGRLWAGASYVDGDGWQGYFVTNSGLRENAVIDNAADGTDRVWFAHPNGGVSVRGATLPPLAESVPLISDITPKSGSAGDQFQVLGSGFGTDRAAIEVSVGGVPVEVIGVAETSITVRLNQNNISGNVSVVKNRKRRTTASNIFCAIPRITNITPTGGTVGVPVTITGTNFDPRAQVMLGGSARDGWVRSPTQITTEIRDVDGVGAAKVFNQCGNEATAAVSFNKIDLSVDQLILSQGLPGYPLIYGRPTFFQHYLRRSSEPRPTDTMAVDWVEITFTDPRNNASYTYRRPHSGAIPSTLGAPPPALLADIVNSLNVFNVAPIGGAGFRAGDLKIDVELLNRGRRVTQFSTVRRFEQNISMRVILVPIMRQNYTAAQLQTLKTNTDRNLDEVRRRILPTGDVDFIWSNDIIVPDEQLELDNFFELFQYAPQLDRARSRWNDRSNSDALITFGVVEPTIVTGSADGYGLWPDASAMANAMGLSLLDTLCDIGNTAVQVLSFGLFGSDDGCHLELPLYIGWAKGDDGVARADNNGINRTMQSSYLFAHEIGHILNLVKPWAVNGSIDDNLSHSINDEIGPLGDFDDPSKSCGQLAEGYFDWNLSLYVQPGVSAPILNPITGQQHYPQNNGNAWTARAKAMMSYACAKYNNNAYFEPVDHGMIRATVGGTDLSGFINNLLPRAAAITDGDMTITPRQVAGRRLHVVGNVARDGSSGELIRVEALSEDAPLSLGFETGYWLVQRGADGGELARIGLFPVFDTIHKHDDHEPQEESPIGFFATTFVLDEATLTVELVHDNAVLDTFTAGTAAPTVQIVSPNGGSFNGGDIPVTWTASDADGDALEISVDYSADDGATWIPVGSSAGSGTVNVLSAELPASDNARMRVVASDGLKSGSATSAAFSVAAQLPQIFISAPLDGAIFGEAQIVDLIGGGRDATDGYLPSVALNWSSDRDGDLGNGDLVSVYLSVGTHILTLTAQNSAGLTATATATVVVEGDYDGDSILDAVEAADGLNALTANDAMSDADGDGLSLRMERNWGTDPNVADSDGDGRADDVEIGEGSNATVNDTAPAPDQLKVWPAALSFEADLSGNDALPQQPIQVTSRNPAAWTMSSDVPWLLFSQEGGQTPGVPTVIVNPAALENGVHTGVLTFSADGLNSVTLPVTVTVTNKANYCDANGDGVLDQSDVDGVSARVGSNNTQDDFAFRYDLDRDGDVDQEDVTLAQACLASAGSGQQIFLPAVQR
jgi:hypothetical protein